MEDDDKNIWIAIADGKTKIALELLRSGTVQVNAKDDNGYTPIHAAASYGDEEVLRYLLANGADVNIRDNSQETPLHYCEEVRIAKLLLEHGADPTLHNSDGQTPADSAEEDENDTLRDYLNEAKMTAEKGKKRWREEAEDLLLISFSDMSQIAFITTLLENSRQATPETVAATSEGGMATVWSGVRGDIVIIEADKPRIDQLIEKLNENKQGTGVQPFVSFVASTTNPDGSSSTMMTQGATSATDIKTRKLTRRQAAALIDWSQFGDSAEQLKEGFLKASE